MSSFHIFLSLGRIGTHTTHAHSRYELREIRHLQMTVIQIVHQEIGISSNLVALIIETAFHHHLTLDITGRMQWQPATSHLPASILAANPFPHHLLGIQLIHEDTIGIEEVAIRLPHLLHNVRYRILGKHKVIRMAESNHITRRHSDTLVDSLIHTMVRFRDKLHLNFMIGDSLTLITTAD